MPSADFPLPHFRVSVNGDDSRPRNDKREYERGKVPQALFYSHYASYFGDDRGLVEHSSDVAGGRKLMVIGDSFDNILERLLAARYEKACFVDPGLYRKENGVQFDPEDFVMSHSIDDLIFIGSDSWVPGSIEAQG